MGSISSRQAGIAAANFTQLRKNRVRKADSVVRVGENHYVIKLATGQFVNVSTRSSVNHNVHVINFNDRLTLEALAKLGACTQEEVDAHMEWIDARAASYDRKWAIDSLQKSCERLGIPVPDVPE